MKKIVSVIFAVMLLMGSLTTCAFAADGSQQYSFDLIANDASSTKVALGDPVTVQAVLSRSDHAGNFSMYAVSVTVRFNAKMLFLTETNCMEGVDYTVTPLTGGWEGWSDVKLSALAQSVEGDIWDNRTTIATLHFNTIAQGSSEIMCRNGLVSTYSGMDAFESKEVGAKVDVVNKGSVPTTPTKPSTGDGDGSGGGGGGTVVAPENPITNPDGSVTTKVTDSKTGLVTETTKYPNGNQTVKEIRKDGSSRTMETRTDGTTVETHVSVDGNVTASVIIPQNGGEKKITLPMKNAQTGNVVVVVKADGTEEILKDSVPTKDGMTFTANESINVKVIDNGKSFDDTKNHWASDAVGFVTARELFNGTSSKTFSPENGMTRGMLTTVLARLDGQDTTGGANWYDKGTQWAKDKGISDGTNPNGAITRQQLAAMLYRYAGNPEADGTLSGFKDADAVSDYAKTAMTWAVKNGIITGMGDHLLNPNGNATRAQVATMLMRFVAM